VDDVAISFDGSLAADGSPFAGGVEEPKVDLRILVKVVCLTTLGVGMEDEIDAVAFLLGSEYEMLENG